MRKLFIVLVLIILIGIQILAGNVTYSADLSKQLKQEMELLEQKHSPYGSIFELNIFNKKYTCYNNNCYNLESLRYNKLIKTYYIDTLFDLMQCDAHQEYESPYHDGYITHLIFNTKLHDNKIIIKCKGFVTGNIVVDYKNGHTSSAHYIFKDIHMKKPATIKNIKEYESISMNEDIHIKLFKNLVNNSKD